MDVGLDERILAEALAESLRLSNRQCFELLALLDPPFDSWMEVSLKERRRAVRKLGAPLLTKMLRLSWARHHLGEEDARPGADFEAALAEAERLAAIEFPLLGRDARALGVREGPELGELLDAVETWWAERDFAPSRADCLERLKELIAAN